MLMSCAAAGDAASPRTVPTTTATVVRRTQRTIADVIKFCRSDGSNSPSPARGCRRAISAAAQPLRLRAPYAPVWVQPARVRCGRMWHACAGISVRSVSALAPPPEVPPPARQRSVRRAAVPRRAPQGSSPDGAVLLPAVAPSGQGSGRHRRRTPARRRGIVADLTVADSVIANLAIVGRPEAPVLPRARGLRLA